MPYYLAPLIGTGIGNDPVRPRGYFIASMRPDGSTALMAEPGAGIIYLKTHKLALIYLPTPSADPLLKKLADVGDEPLSLAAKTHFKAQLGDQPLARTFNAAIGEMLCGKIAGVAPLQATWQGQYEVWCGHPTIPLWSSLKPIAGGSGGGPLLIQSNLNEPMAREFWPVPRHRQFFADVLGFLPTVSLCSISLLVIAGLISPEWLALLFGTLPVTDAFTGADGTALETYNSSWVLLTSSPASAISINTNAARADSGSQEDGYRWTGDSFNTNHYSQGTRVAVTATAPIGVGVRLQSGSRSGYGYWANSNSSSKEIFREDSGTKTALGAGGAAVLNDVYYLSANGSTITGNLNGSLDTAISGNPFTDTTYTGGAAGLWASLSNSNARLDNWQADNLAGDGGGDSGTVVQWVGII